MALLSWFGPGSAQRPRHAEAEDGDEVALDLVGTAAEGEDDHGAGVHLEPAGDHRRRGAAGQVAGLPDDLHQRAGRPAGRTPCRRP